MELNEYISDLWTETSKGDLTPQHHVCKYTRGRTPALCCGCCWLHTITPRNYSTVT